MTEHTHAYTLSWTEARLVEALKSRYGENEWAMMTQVRQGAGWNKRTFDAIAIGLWGSRGHPVHGFECKTSRSDWSRELAKPEKADPLAAFCTYWWVVAPKSIVDPLSLPLGWGLLEAWDNGTVHTIAEAERRDPEPFTRGFVAQVLKRALAADPNLRAVREATKKGYDRGISEMDSRLETERASAERARQRVRDIEAAAGLRLDGAGHETLRKYGDTIRRVVEAEGRGFDTPFSWLENARRQAQKFIDRTADIAVVTHRDDAA